MVKELILNNFSAKFRRTTVRRQPRAGLSPIGDNHPDADASSNRFMSPRWPSSIPFSTTNLSCSCHAKDSASLQSSDDIPITMDHASNH